MCAGVLLHRFATVDEFDLHGRGRALPVAGVLSDLGGVLLASAPPFSTFAGKSLLEAAASGGRPSHVRPCSRAAAAPARRSRRSPL